MTEPAAPPAYRRSWKARIETGFSRLESALAVAGLMLMLGLSLLEVVLRNFFHTSLPGSDVLVRYLVLWVSFLGAVLAVRERHIKVEVISAWMPEDWRRHLERPIFLFSAAVCATLAWAAWRFWYDEWLSVPAGEKWIATLGIIIPASFVLLTLHYALRFVVGPRRRERPA